MKTQEEWDADRERRIEISMSQDKEILAGLIESLRDDIRELKNQIRELEDN